jgi:hypothetical protein
VDAVQWFLSRHIGGVHYCNEMDRSNTTGPTLETRQFRQAILYTPDADAVLHNYSEQLHACFGHYAKARATATRSQRSASFASKALIQGFGQQYSRRLYLRYVIGDNFLLP